MAEIDGLEMLFGNADQPKATNVDNNNQLGDPLELMFGNVESEVAPAGETLDPSFNPRLGNAPSIPTGEPIERKERFGDSLKPIFGGHNPIAETIDTFIDPLTDISSDRPLLDRAVDTAHFVASVPFGAVRAPSPGQIIESLTGSPSARLSEERFIENNPKLLNALGSLGEVAVGVGGTMGQGFRAPAARVRNQHNQQLRAQISDDITRARKSAQNMQDLDVKPFGPVVSMAKRGDNSAGAITQALQDKPIVGTPLQRGANQFFDEMGQAHKRIRQEFGSAETLQQGGGKVRAALDDFATKRSVEISLLDDAQVNQLAKLPPRISTYKDVQAAKYTRAERLLPDGAARASTEGGTAAAVTMKNTRDILQDITRRFNLTRNVTDPTEFQTPKWTGSSNIDASLDAIFSTRRWHAGIEGMREIRSNIRRALAAKGDTEVNALSRGDLKRLGKAINHDMDRTIARFARQADIRGDKALANRYRSAAVAYKDADAFTARFASKLDEVKTLFRADSDEAAAQSIKTAMKDGGTGNLKLLVSLKKILPREAMDELASSLLVDLGKPTGNAAGAALEAGFSASRFSTQWQQLSPRARKVVFGHRPELAKALDKFADIAVNLKDYEKLANNSRTGVSNMIWSAIGGGGVAAGVLNPSSLVGLIGVITSTRGAARYLSSPAYVNWLTRTTSIMKNGKTPGGISKQLTRLKNIVLKDKRLASQEQQALLLAITEASQPTN